MPTIILLDTSSSMDVRICRRKLDVYTPLQFTISAIHTFLDEISVTAKHELVAALACGAQAEILSAFTRDYDQIKEKIGYISPGRTFNLYEGLAGVESLVFSEWSSDQPVTIIAVYEESSVKDLSALEGVDLSISGRLLLLGLQEGYEPDCQELMLKIRAENLDVVLLQPHLPVTEESLSNLFSSIVDSYYPQCVSLLTCGLLSSKVTLWPPIESSMSVTDFEVEMFNPEPQLDIIGFLDIKTLGRPATTSKHLVSPWVPPPPPIFPGVRQKPHTEDDDDPNSEANVPSFCVLLHGALRVENMVALCTIAQDWFGVLFSWADSKRKCNLMLGALPPGRNSVPWLGDMNALTIPSSPQGCEGFPVKCDKKSYSQNGVAWIKKQGLASDIQKILRHSKKLPEKTQQFYKELNKVRKAAICFGYSSLLERLAALLERECRVLPGTVHPACAFQLSHAATILREPYSKDPKYTIMPMKTSF